MDNSTVEHSDSDSGESWTLLESSPTYADEAPDPENAANQSAREHVDPHSEKDEDTDGISIISDSEPESPHCELSYVQVLTEESPPEPQELTALSSPLVNDNQNNESIKEETDFLGDNIKYKTYVHKRNPKVGSILDIIMLGTFVITAGMALGHLWSCKNECTMQTSVNKILMNSYKLQKENEFLKSKLKEITEATASQLTEQLKSINNKPYKQFRCKKIFEEPVLSNNKKQIEIKCIDDNKPDGIFHNSLEMPEYEKEFLKDIEKLKVIYEQHKGWMDKEVKRQFEEFEKVKFKKRDLQLNGEQLDLISIQLNHPDLIPDINSVLDTKTHRHINLVKQLDAIYSKIKQYMKPEFQEVKGDTEMFSELQSGSSEDTNAHSPGNIQTEQLPEKKITYADSLKIDQPLQRSKRSENNEPPSRSIKAHTSKRKHKEEDLIQNLNTFSDDDIKKDDRYNGPKPKYDKKKHDRQKSYKKQKRNNKYEQWEMKGGYLKDFDEFSITSSQDNISINKPEKKFLNTDFENYVSKVIEAKNNASDEELPKITKNIDERANKSEKRLSKSDRRKKGKTKDYEWYDQRSALRAEARQRLEHELFGENTPNNAAWYFRRMQKREQCRAQKDNSTLKKFYERKMNFKMKR